MRISFFVLCMGLVAPAWAQTVFKCTGPNGGVVIQQTTCSGGQRVNVRPNGVPAEPATRNQYDASTAAAADRLTVAVAAGISAGYPVVGMTMGQLQQAIGHPSRINFADYGRGHEEQRIYERGGRTFYVYTDNGRVRSIQNTVVPVRAARACPGDIEIRNMETTASSTGLSDDVRRDMLRRIADMRACR